MTKRHFEIIDQIQKDNIVVSYNANLGTPGKYFIDKNGNCSIEIDCNILNGSDPEYSDKRIELVFYHEWGHIMDYRKDPKKFIRLNSRNPCHENLEYEAYRHALQVAFDEAQKGDKELLNEALKRYTANMSNTSLDIGYKKALSKIFESELWKDSQKLI